jgi:DNA-binding beta-propeller fold protein YncE
MTTHGNRSVLQLNARLLSFLALLVAISIFSFADGHYHIVKTVPIPGQGGWDYLIVDESARRLYVSHGTQVEVLDGDSGAIVGKTPNTLGVHGIAIAPELARGFVSDGQTSTVTIFDLKTRQTIGEVPTGKKPDGIIYDPATSM